MSISVKQVTGLAATGNTAITWNAPSQKVSIADTSNLRYIRVITLSADGVLVSYPGYTVGLAIADILSVALAQEPNLAAPPLITVQPVALSVTSNAPVTFSVTATGEIAISYKWQYTSDGSNWFDLIDGGGTSNSATATVTITPALAFNSYLFRCRVYLTAQPTKLTYSKGAKLTVSDPLITTQPSSHSIAAPTATSFGAIAAVGNTTLSYQWQVSSDSGVSWSNATGGVYTNDTTTTLNISNSTGLNAKQYRCAVTDANGTTNTNAAILTVT